MRRAIAVLAALFSLIICVQWQWPGQASAAADPVQLRKSAGQAWGLKSLATGKFVSAPAVGAGGDYARLRAVAGTIGVTERFTLHTEDKGAHISLRSEGNGMFVSTDVNNSDKLRAQGDHLGTWEQLTLTYDGSDVDGEYYKLFSPIAGKYVAADLSYATTDPDYAVLRARTPDGARIGSWERFRLVPAGDDHVGADAGDTKQWGTPPTPATPSSSSVKVMAWNLCGDQNTGCTNHHATPDHIADQVIGQLGDVSATYMPDALFFEETCEKFAKSIETALESRTGTGWDVRFAPIYYGVTTGGGTVKAQKECADATGYGNRGAYGISLAVPEENTWYRAHILDSPAGAEQRAALCAAVESKAVMYCGAHFSTGGAGYEDTDWSHHGTQRDEVMADLANARTGNYRVVFGGDLNVNPPGRGWDGHAVLDPAYDAYRECSQLQDPNSARDGQNTANNSKIDYIFGAGHTACAVSAGTWGSDHHALRSTTVLP
ncbi:endonuclease/exonuclease/phosphatase family protein [Streptomyces actinomycinicus]|uniref:Endonuclease/exonuclease/phosphatase family protein n=1 Tax=Streptomyces actinomycinicus TaxID=1695166 RepID=A0A937JLJ1_9ACTN|nr:endonuclease/exonuclease/phosphatase family protein [Streptomyces actinomycinicus]MBL1081386.1 endonuclease/exonuclease/phosphatase family protein [Streptomyces actinomycinicus]